MKVSDLATALMPLPFLGAAAAAAAAAAPSSHPQSDKRATSGPVFGEDGRPACTDIQALSGADWLMAPLCAMTVVNANWAMEYVYLVNGDVDWSSTDMVASAIEIYMFDENLADRATTVQYTDATGDKRDNTGAAWYGGAYDVAAIAMVGAGVTDGALVTLKTAGAAVDVYDTLGVTGLTMLTGIQGVKETIPADDTTFVAWLEKCTTSPVLIFTSDTCPTLATNQYYAVVFAAADKATLWNPLVSPDTTNATVSVSDLRTCSTGLYHLANWAGYPS